MRAPSLNNKNYLNLRKRSEPVVFWNPITRYRVRPDWLEQNKSTATLDRVSDWNSLKDAAVVRQRDIKSTGNEKKGITPPTDAGATVSGPQQTAANAHCGEGILLAQGSYFCRFFSSAGGGVEIGVCSATKVGGDRRRIEGVWRFRRRQVCILLDNGYCTSSYFTYFRR